MLFDKHVILLDQVVNTREEALSKLADSLYQTGVVTDQYKEAILAREAKFPTGLMTQTYGVAIPHCDPDKVNEPQIGFLRLTKPVVFHQMGDNEKIEVNAIFMLALKKSDDQLTMLQTLMALFQNQKLMEQLNTVNSTDRFLALMQKAQIID